MGLLLLWGCWLKTSRPKRDSARGFVQGVGGNISYSAAVAVGVQWPIDPSSRDWEWEFAVRVADPEEAEGYTCLPGSAAPIG